MLKVFSDSSYKYSTIIFARKSNDENKILYLDLINKTKNYSFGRINDAEITQRLSYLKDKGLVNERLINGIISSSKGWSLANFTPSLYKNWVKKWIDSEYDETMRAESNPTPVTRLSTSNQRFFIDRYHFEDMLNVIDNSQFTDELNQCIFAYRHEKWFLCASGLGSCLEHLMYIILKNYDDKGYKTLNKFAKNPTANEYVGRFRKPPLSIDSRRARAINLYFMARNSVDHFNTGKTQRIFCDLLFDGISDVYNDYYGQSVNAPMRNCVN